MDNLRKSGIFKKKFAIFLFAEKAMLLLLNLSHPLIPAAPSAQFREGGPMRQELHTWTFFNHQEFQKLP